jgi:hypothetical protein
LSFCRETANGLVASVPKTSCIRWHPVAARPLSCSLLHCAAPSSEQCKVEAADGLKMLTAPCPQAPPTQQQGADVIIPANASFQYLAGTAARSPTAPATTSPLILVPCSIRTSAGCWAPTVAPPRGSQCNRCPLGCCGRPRCALTRCPWTSHRCPSTPRCWCPTMVPQLAAPS